MSLRSLRNLFLLRRHLHPKKALWQRHQLTHLVVVVSPAAHHLALSLLAQCDPENKYPFFSWECPWNVPYSGPQGIEDFKFESDNKDPRRVKAEWKFVPESGGSIFSTTAAKTSSDSRPRSARPRRTWIVSTRIWRECHCSEEAPALLPAPLCALRTGCEARQPGGDLCLVCVERDPL